MSPNLDPAASAEVTKHETQAAGSKGARRLTVATLLTSAALLSTTALLTVIDVPKLPPGAGD